MSTEQDISQSRAEYYLHENGDLIRKPHGDVERESPFVKEVWEERLIAASADKFLEFLKEAKALGARHSRIKAIAEHSGLTRIHPTALAELEID